jgi:hypothetical protein
MKPDLAILEHETRAAMAEAQKLFAPLTPEQTIKRPHPNAWSPAECLQHLTLTAEAYTKVFDEQIQRAAKYSDQPYTPGWLARWFLGNVDIPVKRGFKTRSAFIPPTNLTGEQALRSFLASHEALLARIPQLEPLDLRKIRVKSPFAEWMTYPLGLVCYMVPAHCRRHLCQAREALD